MRPTELYEPPPRRNPPRPERSSRLSWRMLLLGLPLVAFGGLAALLFVRLGAGDASLVPSAMIGQPAPVFTLPALTPGAPDVTVDALRQGKVTLVNVFASWCVPCHEEHATLAWLAAEPGLKAEGVRLVGIAYKDAPEASRHFLETDGNPFAAVGVDRNGRVGIDWGVYGVPETFVVRGDGTIAYKLVGPLTPDIVTATLLPEIAKARR